MILYLDTSALVKLFVEEAGSGRVRAAVTQARLVATHTIAYVEACAAFARLGQDREDEALFAKLRENLDAQWEAWEILGVTEPLVRRAADFAGGHRLRGYDCVHLAAAEAAFEVFRGNAPFHFAVFDAQLSEAARQTGIPLLEN